MLHILIFLISQISFAQQDARTLKFDSSKPIKISYESPSWNKDPSVPDNSYVLIRDAQSGQMARVLVTETGADTGVFSGTYQVSFSSAANPNTAITPEIYIPPQEMLKDLTKMNSIANAIQERTLLRKPFFIRPAGNMQSMNIFDSKAQAYEAYNKHLKGINDKQMAERANEAKRLAEAEAERLRLADIAKKAEAERLRLAALEKARIEQLRLEQERMSAEEKAKRHAEAARLAEQAMAHYQKGEYAKAENKFEKAYELDPNNSKYFFQYGATLYRNNKYNESLVMLNLAKGPEVNQNEVEFFRGLNFVKLEEYDKAHKRFTSLQDKNVKPISATSAFYAGVIDFQKEKFDDANGRFEYVLDNSDDPQLDQQAEAYIEQIINIKKFLAKKEHPWTISLTGGVTYDSNITNASTQNSATNKAGFRWLYSLGILRRIVFNETTDFSASFNYTDMYSMNSSFAAEKALQDVDPLVMSFSLPYKLSGKFFEKSGQLEITPSYEIINLNADATGSRENISASTVLKFDQTLATSEDLISKYTFEYRSDASKITAASTDDDLTATKYTLATTQTFFTDDKKTKAWIGDLSYAMNNALGKNTKFNRYDLGGSYLSPAFSDCTWTGKLSYFSSTYPDASSGRKDSGTTLTLTLIQPLSDSLTAVYSAATSNNASNVSDYQYNKFTLTALLSWSGIF